MKQIMCSAQPGQDFLQMVMLVILKNVKLQDFWINFCSILKACIEKVRWSYILHLRFDILHKMNRIASNEEKISELSVSRPLLRFYMFEIKANKMLEGALLYCRSMFKLNR